MNLATVSMTNATTPKLTNRYVCYTDGTDVACNEPSLFVTTGGLIGIGTASPDFKLTIENATGNSDIAIGQGASNRLMLDWVTTPRRRAPTGRFRLTVAATRCASRGRRVVAIRC